MTLLADTLYADDPDVHADWSITDSLSTNDFPAAVETICAGHTHDTEPAASWEGAAAATRTLRVDLYGLGVGVHVLRLTVPGGNDVYLGSVRLD